MNDSKRPTHLQMVIYLHEYYKKETFDLVQRIGDLTSEIIERIVEERSENRLCPEKMQVICKFLISKIEMLKCVYSD